MSMIRSYAAKEAGGELEVYEYDPGELRPQDIGSAGGLLRDLPFRSIDDRQ